MAAGKVHRRSRQRDVILDELRKLDTHPTAADLHRVVRKRLPRISLGTIYRNLDLLVRQGTVVKMDTAGPEKRFDGNPDRHYHICCLSCGRVDDLHDLHELPEQAVGEVEGIKGYEVVGHHLQFKGICPACQKERDAMKEDFDHAERHDQ